MKLTRWSWVVLAAVSCRPAATGALFPHDPCRIPPASPARLDTVTVAFSPRENEAGRQMLRLTGETLIRVNCQGETLPSLATRWDRDASGTTWTFELDSSLVALSLVEQWDLRRNGGFWPWNRILEVRALNRRQVQVRLDSVFAVLPQAFAVPELSAAPSDFPGRGVIRVLVHASTIDQRDLLDRPAGSDRGVDLLLTRDPAAISYARGRAGFSVVPLAWDRTYVAIAPGRRLELGPDLTGLKQSLVREVVRSDSRVADGPAWWETASCGGTQPLLPTGRRPEVVYLQEDVTAREIAERLVALQPATVHAAGLPLEDFHASLAAGEAVLYVLALPRTHPAGCRTTPPWPSGSSVVPLVESRAHAIVRDGVPGFTVEGDGTIRFEELRRLIPPLLAP